MVDARGGPIVLAGLPDDRMAVVLAAVVHSDPDSQGQSSQGGSQYDDVISGDAGGLASGCLECDPRSDEEAV